VYSGLFKFKMLSIIATFNKYLFKFLLILASFLSVLFFYMVISTKIQNNNKKVKLKELPFVTVQIPTYNELAALRCAKQCLKFDYPKNRYEIIIGDDSNNKEISKKIDDFARKQGIKVTRRGTNHGYKPGNLNHMLKFSKGEIIVIFDSDFIPPRNFLKEIVKPFQDEKVCAVQARWAFVNSTKNLVSMLGATIIATVHHVVLPFISKKAKMSFLCGSAEAVRKKTLLELGGWQSGSLTEDIEFSLRAIKHGYKIVYLESLECKGEVPYKPLDLYKQQMRWAYGFIKAFKEHILGIITSKKINFKEKLYTPIALSGYLLTTIVTGLIISGILNMFINYSATFNFGKFILEISRNFFLSSGIILTSIVSWTRSHKCHKHKILHMLVASFTHGLIVMGFVMKGITNVIFNRNMKWYMLNKEGNLTSK